MFDILGAVFEFTEKLLSQKWSGGMFVFFGGVGGHVCVVGLFWRHWASVLDDFRLIWGAQIELKSILRHLMGPMVPPRGFLRAQGCHFG